MHLRNPIGSYKAYLRVMLGKPFRARPLDFSKPENVTRALSSKARA